MNRRAFLVGASCAALLGASGVANALRRRAGLMAMKGETLYCQNRHRIATFLEDAYVGQMPWPKLEWHQHQRTMGERDWFECDECGGPFFRAVPYDHLSWRGEHHFKDGWRGAV